MCSWFMHYKNSHGRKSGLVNRYKECVGHLQDYIDCLIITFFSTYRLEIYKYKKKKNNGMSLLIMVSCKNGLGLDRLLITVD